MSLDLVRRADEAGLRDVLTPMAPKTAHLVHIQHAMTLFGPAKFRDVCAC